MSWLTDLLDVYGRVLSRAFDLTIKHWWLGLIAIAYVGIFFALLVVAEPEHGEEKELLESAEEFHGAPSFEGGCHCDLGYCTTA